MKVIAEANLFTEEMRRNFSAEAERFILNHQKGLDAMGVESTNAFSKTATDLRNQHFAELRNLYEKSLQEVVQYRKEALARAEKEIYGIVAEVAKKVLRKALDADLHQQIVMEALERAKKEGFFEL